MGRGECGCHSATGRRSPRRSAGSCLGAGRRGVSEDVHRPKRIVGKLIADLQVEGVCSGIRPHAAQCSPHPRSSRGVKQPCAEPRLQDHLGIIAKLLRKDSKLDMSPFSMARWCSEDIMNKNFIRMTNVIQRVSSVAHVWMVPQSILESYSV